MTKETFDDEMPYVYSFMWYKKEGGSVLKAVDARNIQSVYVVQTQRPLVYVPKKKSPLMLKVDSGGDPTSVTVQATEQTDSASNLGMHFTSPKMIVYIFLN
jgi:hypothetical protein